MVRLPNRNNVTFAPGSAITCSNGALSCCAADVFPDYIFLKYATKNGSDVYCYPVTDNMVFKTEYISSIPPKLGMAVGMSTSNGKSDRVTFNSNGKGIILEINSSEGIVYVKFRKK